MASKDHVEDLHYLLHFLLCHCISTVRSNHGVYGKNALSLIICAICYCKLIHVHSTFFGCKNNVSNTWDKEGLTEVIDGHNSEYEHEP